ncbi:MAG: alpha/beta hydrolase [Deltaproteobacteria bacterium]|nr:alpha/beta hydrolase [Deltaproteobacteria bacterium]MBW2359805.1 alpha/beta hydrolase [Deltaproteobacteria bacterium]
MQKLASRPAEWAAAHANAPSWFERALATPVDERRVEVEGCSIRYLRWGQPERPGIVLVHGGAANAHWWSHIAPLFPEYCVAALDLSGHGDSGRRDAYPRETWAREVLAVAEDAGIAGPPIVIGHSMGGFVTIMAAAEYGERIAGAVILDSPVRLPSEEERVGQAGQAFRAPKVYPDIESALARYRTVPDQPSSLPYVMHHVARHSLRAVDGGYTWSFDRAIFQHVIPRASAEELPRVKSRVALFRAEYGLVTPDIGAQMYELLGRVAPVIEIPEAHHHIMLDQPLLLVTGLRTLLADWEHSVPHARR